MREPSVEELFQRFLGQMVKAPDAGKFSYDASMIAASLLTLAEVVQNALGRTTDTKRP